MRLKKDLTYPCWLWVVGATWETGESLLGPKGNPQLSASKGVGISVLQPQGNEPAKTCMSLEMDSPLELPERNATLPEHILSLALWYSEQTNQPVPWDFWPIELRDKKFVISQIAKFMVISYSRKRNWIWLLTSSAALGVAVLNRGTESRLWTKKTPILTQREGFLLTLPFLNLHLLIF